MGSKYLTYYGKKIICSECIGKLIKNEERDLIFCNVCGKEFTKEEINEIKENWGD